jgi:hypothetical protein
MPPPARASVSGRELNPVLSQDRDRSWADPMESEQLSLAGSVGLGDRAKSGGLERSGGRTAHGRR